MKGNLVWVERGVAPFGMYECVLVMNFHALYGMILRVDCFDVV